MRVALVASLLLVGCTAAARSPASSSSAPALVPAAPVAASAPVEPPPTPTPAPPPERPPPVELTDGTYWVRRVVAENGRGSNGYSPEQGAGEHWVRFRTECQKLTLTTVGRRRDLVIGDVGVSAFPETDTWTIASPVVSSRLPPASLAGQCKDIVRPADLPIYRDEASCRVAPSTVTQRCRGEACRYDTDAPFVLPSCDAAVAALTAELAPIAQASHAEALRSLRRMAAITERGGTMWLRDFEVDRCAAVTVTPRRDGAVALRQSIATPGGGRIELRAEVTFEPLYHRARFASESRWHEGPGGGGGYGIGPTTTGMYLGRDVALVGARWFYFDRKRCTTSHATTP